MKKYLLVANFSTIYAIPEKSEGWLVGQFETIEECFQAAKQDYDQKGKVFLTDANQNFVSEYLLRPICEYKVMLPRIILEQSCKLKNGSWENITYHCIRIS